MPVAVPTLTIADNADGTGAVATVADSTALSTNTLYSAPVTGTLAGGTWTSRGSRTGDGTIAAAITDTGYYWWKVVSSLSGESDVSNLVYAPVTDGADAVHFRLLAAVQARMQLLTLSGIASSDIVIRDIITDAPGHVPSPMPICVIGPVGREQIGFATNTNDQYGYPIAVCFFAASNQDLVTLRPTYLKWREQGLRAFQNATFSGVDELLFCTVEPDPIIPLSQWMGGMLASAFVIRCQTRQTRGLT